MTGRSRWTRHQGCCAGREPSLGEGSGSALEGAEGLYRIKEELLVRINDEVGSAELASAA